MSRHRHGVKTIYALMRKIMRFFALFIVMIVAVVAWRKLWVEDKALMALERGELVSLGILVLIAAVLWLFAGRVGREIEKV
ncbi:MAG: hypothetical protein ACR2OM_10955 [Aestuariivirgaceae bacterium]